MKRYANQGVKQYTVWHTRCKQERAIMLSRNNDSCPGVLLGGEEETGGTGEMRGYRGNEGRRNIFKVGLIFNVT